MLLYKLLQNLSAVLVFLGYFGETGHDSVLENLIPSVANKHYQLYAQIHALLQSNLESSLGLRLCRYGWRVSVDEIVDGFGVGFELGDFIGGQSGGFLNVFDFGEEFCQRDDDFGAENVLNVFDIGFPGHVISNGQEPVPLLSDDFESLPDISFYLLIYVGGSIVFFKQFDKLDDNGSVDFAILSVNTLLFASQVDCSKHHQRHFIGHFYDIVRL